MPKLNLSGFTSGARYRQLNMAPVNPPIQNSLGTQARFHEWVCYSLFNVFSGFTCLTDVKDNGNWSTISSPTIKLWNWDFVTLHTYLWWILQKDLYLTVYLAYIRQCSFKLHIGLPFIWQNGQLCWWSSVVFLLVSVRRVSSLTPSLLSDIANRWKGFCDHATRGAHQLRVATE